MTLCVGEGFTVAEGYDILPHLAKSRPNLVESHTALLLSAYLKAGLPSALIEVIVTGDTVLSVRAAVLLGQFLHLVSLLLPHEISSVQLCLPQLTRYVDTSQPDYCSQKSTKALAAVTGMSLTLFRLGTYNFDIHPPTVFPLFAAWVLL